MTEPDQPTVGIPTEPGFYWAKKNATQPEYNIIVEIFGEAPWLRYRAWDTTANVSSAIVTSGDKPNFIFGQRIARPKPQVKTQ